MSDEIKYEHLPEPLPEPVPQPVPTSVAEITETVKPTTLNKNGKPRKTLSAEALEKLKLAREKANAIRQAACVKKHEEQTALIEDTIDKFEKGEIKCIPEDPKPKPKTRGKKKTKIIVEQSSEDSDEFEPNDNVVFVKRVSRKKKDPPVPAQICEPMTEPEIPKIPTQRQPTPQEIQLKNQYNQMFSGGFMTTKRGFY